jgi:hypothetical protein
VIVTLPASPYASMSLSKARRRPSGDHAGEIGLPAREVDRNDVDVVLRGPGATEIDVADERKCDGE